MSRLDDYYEPDIARDPVAWLAHHLPRAIAWAEQEARQQRLARIANLDRAVATSRCAIGHDLDWQWWQGQKFYDHGARGACGYCGSAYTHQRTPETVSDGNGP
jgi:hypothetical protein